MWVNFYLDTLYSNAAENFISPQNWTDLKKESKKV